MAVLQSIAIKLTKKGPMILVPFRDIDIEKGLVGDCRGKGGLMRERQITVLSQEQWEAACTELGKELRWETRRANLLVQGIAFGPEHIGKRLYIGLHVVLEITGETDPCRRMDEAHDGLKKALSPDWRGGVTCRVLREGPISVGNQVELI